MNTQSHAILTTFLLRKGLDRWARGVAHFHTVAAAGALAPDLPLYGFFAWYTLVARVPQRRIWGELYFDPRWQALFHSFHSFPLWILAAAGCWLARKHLGVLFCCAGLLASAQDFLLHHEDAHAHFYPFSSYRFASPVSYWNPAYHGQLASLLEAVLTTAAAAWLFSRLHTRWGRAILVGAVAALWANHGLWGYLFRHF
ncbi:MAG: hypothetical protein Kow0092_35770 [Deferrisomatales bacterium]